MSLTSALADIKSRLVATGLTEVEDKRDLDMSDAPKSAGDGRFLLQVTSVGNPWPEIARTPTAWWAGITLQVSTLMSNDRDAAAISEDTRAHLIIKALHYQQPAGGQVWDMQPPISNTVPTSQRVRVWSWTFRLRYTE